MLNPLPRDRYIAPVLVVGLPTGTQKIRNAEAREQLNKDQLLSGHLERCRRATDPDQVSIAPDDSCRRPTAANYLYVTPFQPVLTGVIELDQWHLVGPRHGGGCLFHDRYR